MTPTNKFLANLYLNKEEEKKHFKDHFYAGIYQQKVSFKNQTFSLVLKARNLLVTNF